MPSIPTAGDLERLEQAMFDAMKAGDSTALETLLSDDLEYFHSSGRVQSKRDVLQEYATPRSKKNSTSGTTTHCYPGVGVASTVWQTTIETAGVETAIRLRVVYVWAEEPKGWRLVYRQTTRLPELK